MQHIQMNNAKVSDQAIGDRVLAKKAHEEKLRRQQSDDERSTSASSGSDADPASSGEEEQGPAKVAAPRPVGAVAKPAADDFDAAGTLTFVLALLSCARRARPEEQQGPPRQPTKPLPPKQKPRKQQPKVTRSKQTKGTTAAPARSDKGHAAPAQIVAAEVPTPPPGLEWSVPSTQDVTSRQVAKQTAMVPPPGLAPPPGLELPPGLATPQGFGAVPPPPGLELPSQKAAAERPAASTKPFERTAFRQELTAVLRDLSWDRNSARAVGRVRAQHVPVRMQAAEYVDIITRTMEMANGMVRRAGIAFVAGLAASRSEQQGTSSAFSAVECLAGIKTFFEDVYPDLCDEVPRLQVIVASELLPTLRTVLPEAQLDAMLPADFRLCQSS